MKVGATEEENGNNKKKKGGVGSFLKWGFVMAGGAIVGAIAVDKYREIKSEKKPEPQMNPAHQAMHTLFGSSPNPFGPQVNVTNFSGPQPPGYMGAPAAPEAPQAPEAPEAPGYEPEPSEPEDTRPDLTDIESEDW